MRLSGVCWHKQKRCFRKFRADASLGTKAGGDHAHKVLDEAVAESYGWGDDWRDGKLTNDEILARLFKLNQERAKAESKAAAQVKVKGKKNGK